MEGLVGEGGEVERICTNNTSERHLDRSVQRVVLRAEC